MKNRKLGQFQVSEIGLGCMNLSHAYGAPVSAEQGERVLLEALAIAKEVAEATTVGAPDSGAAQRPASEMYPATPTAARIPMLCAPEAVPRMTLTSPNVRMASVANAAQWLVSAPG